MIPFFSALHALAAQRGEGLRPELVRLLERDRFAAEARQSETSKAAESSRQAAQRARAAA
ncbi:MAG TPA: hypothetical protein VMU06_23940 [Stellaceae bacterium]|nr:hypothetical protein [Stellaceae bacterium]